PAAVAGYQELLKRDDVDAVYIALPPSLHHTWCLAAAAAGKHVLCEKPMAMNSHQANEIDGVCRQHSVRWMDATGWLHHDRTGIMRRHLSESIGRIRHVSASVSFFEPFLDADHRRDASLGGGCLLDLAWYASGVAIWAIQQPPVAVQADVVQRDGVPFRVSALLRFADDTSATISAAYDTATRKWFEIAGEEASLICDNFTRPWAEESACFGIHDRAGNLRSYRADCHQEHNMIAHFMHAPDLRPMQQQALWTQRTIEMIADAAQSMRSSSDSNDANHDDANPENAT
ncbi:MAG: Gfo/Idh/MocA family oxidoreductase, partial [Planctomycetota bacterium]